MDDIRCVAVVGLGLIGGSLARDLAARGVRVLGYDPDPDALRAARDAGVVHAPLPPDLRGMAEADALVLAVPVSAVAAVLHTARPHLDSVRLVTDVGSVKRGIVAEAEHAGIAERFVGGHPLAGSHRSGWGASHTGLFHGARVFLCPTSRSTPEAIALAHHLWRRVGGSPEILPAEAHDEQLAWTSHLPQVAASALALALAGQGVAVSDLGPGGRDTTRLAGSSPAMWTAICLDNAAALGDAIDVLRQRLHALGDAIRQSDACTLERLLAEGQAWADGRTGMAGVPESGAANAEIGRSPG